MALECLWKSKISCWRSNLCFHWSLLMESLALTYLDRQAFWRKLRKSRYLCSTWTSKILTPILWSAMKDDSKVCSLRDKISAQSITEITRIVHSWLITLVCIRCVLNRDSSKKGVKRWAGCFSLWVIWAGCLLSTVNTLRTNTISLSVFAW